MQTLQPQPAVPTDDSPLPNPVQMSKLKQLINWITRPYDFLDDCAQRYGETFTVNIFGFDNLVFLSNPQAIKEIFSDNGKLFDAGRGQESLIRPLLGSNSLLVLDGDRHRRDRKMLMPPFHGNRVKSYAQAICDITKEIGSQWQSGQQILCGEIMPDITLEVILQTVFGLREGDRYQQLKSLIISWLDLTGSPAGASMLFFPLFQQDLGAWSPWGKVIRKRQAIDALLQAEIEERRAQSEPAGDDVLSLMLLARDEDGNGMTDAALKDELLTMLAAATKPLLLPCVGQCTGFTNSPK